jgi:hypothetical protein
MLQYNFVLYRSFQIDLVNIPKFSIEVALFIVKGKKSKANERL